MQKGLELQKKGATTQIQLIEKSNQAMRIRDIDDPEPIKMALKYVMTMLGLSEKQKPTKLQFDVLFAFIKENFGFISPEKIRLAFDFAISGKLEPTIRPEDLKLFDAPFSPLYVSRIINAFLTYEQKINSKNTKSLHVETEPTEEEKEKLVKEGIIFCWNEYKIKKDCIIPSSFYDYLQRRGIVNYTQELRDKFKEQAKKEITSEKNKDKINSPLLSETISAYVKALTGQSTDVIVRAKSMAIKQWFDDLITMGETPEGRLKGENEQEF